MSEIDKHSKKRPIGDYEVGYGKPPVPSRWNKGQSGNRKGRPKLSGDIAENVDKVLNERLVITLNGMPTRMTVAQALARQMMKDALNGNAAARRELIRRHEAYKERTKAEVDVVYDVTLVLEDDPPGDHARFINGVPAGRTSDLN